jgi:hypothetical protein
MSCSSLSHIVQAFLVTSSVLTKVDNGKQAVNKLALTTNIASTILISSLYHM